VSIDGIDPIRKAEIAEQFRDVKSRHGEEVAVGLIGLAYSLSPDDIATLVKEEIHGRESGTDGTAESQADGEEGEAPAAPATR
jgi:hypothetical protein